MSANTAAAAGVQSMPECPDQTIRWKLSGFADEIDTDPRVHATVMSALGASHLELRSAWNINVVEMTDAQLADLQSVYTDCSMAVSAIASPIGKVDVSMPVEHELDRLERAIHAAHLFECRYIRIFSFYHQGRSAVSVRDAVMSRMRALAEMAVSAGVVLLHENEKDIYGDVPARILDIVRAVDSPALRLAWDPANFVQVGVRPFSEAYGRLRPHIEYLQIKDARFTDGRVTVAGMGDGELLETVTALRASGYRGFASLEPHLASATDLGGFSGPAAFGSAMRAFAEIAARAGVSVYDAS